MNAKRRMYSWESFVVVGIVSALVLLSVQPTAVGNEDTEAFVIAGDLSDAMIENVIRLDLESVTTLLSMNDMIPITLLESDYNLKLLPVELGISEVGSSEISEVYLAATQFYRGIDMGDVRNIRAAVAPDWIHMSFSIEGIDYFVDPIDGTGESGYYAVYSASGVDVENLDLSNDLAPIPSDAMTDSPEEGDIYESMSSSLSNSTCEDDSAVESLYDVTMDYGAAVASAQEPRNNKTCELGGDPEYRLARIILACDDDYRDRYPADWSSRMVTRLNDVCGRYESQVSITFRLAINPHDVPDDQCTSTDSSTLLGQFRTYMRTDPDVSGVTRDLSHLFTGKDLDGSTIGVAWEPGVGRGKWFAGSDLAYSLSEQWHSSFKNTWIMGHEMGHNFNGDHYYWEWVDLCQSWMCPTYGWPMTAQFSSPNADRVRSWAQQALDLQISTNPGPSSVSADNLQSSNLELRGQFVYLANTGVTVSYDIKNVGAIGLNLQLLFVGARDASGANKDFGHLANVWIGSGQTLHFEASYTPQSGGVWTFWPAYKIDNHYGPYMWITVTPTVFYDKGHWIGRDSTTSSHDVDLFYRFYLLTTVPAPNVGSTVIVYVSMFNGKTGTAENTFNYFFVGCRNPSGSNKDFGSSGTQTLTQIGASGCTGEGYLVYASRTLDAAGTWTFWPAYNYGGAYGPYMWNALTLVVV